MKQYQPVSGYSVRAFCSCNSMPNNSTWLCSNPRKAAPKRRDEVEAAWRWADPILAAWADSGEAPRPYTSGTWGPSAAVALIERDGRTWNEDSE